MAQLVKRRVANPAPSVLALVNKSRRKSMATQKKKKSSSSSKKRSSTAAKSTARRQTKPRRQNPPKKASSGKKSHIKRRSSRPRRNPLMSGATGEVLSFAGAGLGLGIFQPIVGNAVGRFLPFGQYNGPILTFGSGWLLSWLFKLLPFTRPLSRPTFILGASTAVIQVTQPFVRNLIGAGASSAPPLMQGRYYRRNGMGAIGAVTGIPPRLVPLPPPPQANGAGRNGMGAVGAVPGRFRR